MIGRLLFLFRISYYADTDITIYSMSLVLILFAVILTVGENLL